MPTLKIGDSAPDFSLPTDKGEMLDLSALRGRPVVLVFYPQDDTEGCTIENIEFTALMPEFDRLNTSVIGISPDSVQDHCSFRDKYDLKLTLAADPDRVAIEAYGLWAKKKNFGHEYIGLIRTTFLIDPAGKIAGIWGVNRIKGHAAKVLEAVKSL